MYKKFITKADCIFFQNKDDLKLFKNFRFIGNNQETTLVPGSGVNLNHFSYSNLPVINHLSFLMISEAIN